LRDWFEIVEIEKGLWAIREPLHIEKVISYLVQGVESALLVDTGMGIGNIREVVSGLTELPIQVVNTHSHYDHVGDDHRFASVAVHEKERSTIERGVDAERVAGLVSEETFKGPPPADFAAERYRIRPAAVSRSLADGDMIGLGGIELRVLHTPGHSPGSICLWEASHQWLFTGDTAYRGPLYAQLPHSDFDAYVKSMRRLSALAPQVRTVLPGHGETPLEPVVIFELAQGFQRIVDGAVEYWYEESPWFGTVRVYQFPGFAIYLPRGKSAGESGRGGRNS
jgi:glyoxylase-like metal-dependent hydrolase (beta-lactamase superfamily II)